MDEEECWQKYHGGNGLHYASDRNNFSLGFSCGVEVAHEEDAQLFIDMIKVLPPPERLEELADFIDSKFPNDLEPEMQTDLRTWAQSIREANAVLAEALGA